jgi:hypothetical protein
LTATARGSEVVGELLLCGSAIDSPSATVELEAVDAARP